MKEFVPHSEDQYYDKAKGWINDYGSRQAEYVIFEAFEKP
mgnify:FL=1